MNSMLWGHKEGASSSNWKIEGSNSEKTVFDLDLKDEGKKEGE